jgi:quinol monooxygenase YgiN
MYGVFWHAVAKPGKKQDFLDFLKWDADVANDLEPATISFDVFEDPENPDAVYVYEAYLSEDAFAEHRKNEPFQRFRNEVRPEWLTELKMIMPFANSVVSKA